MDVLVDFSMIYELFVDPLKWLNFLPLYSADKKVPFRRICCPLSHAVDASAPFRRRPDVPMFILGSNVLEAIIT